MVDDPGGGFADGGEEAGVLGLLALVAVAVGDEDQLVIGRHAFFLDVEGAALDAFLGHLGQLEVAEGAGDGIDLARQQ